LFTQEVAVDDYALTFRHRDGTLTDVTYSASVHRGTGGEMIAVFAAARDVSKLTEAYEAARSMIESSLDSLVAISPEGLITDVNEATVKVTGLPREELIGTAFSDYFTAPQGLAGSTSWCSKRGWPLTTRSRCATGAGG
jgi:PAS domain-containing protein